MMDLIPKEHTLYNKTLGVNFTCLNLLDTKKVSMTGPKWERYVYKTYCGEKQTIDMTSLRNHSPDFVTTEHCVEHNTFPKVINKRKESKLLLKYPVAFIECKSRSNITEWKDGVKKWVKEDPEQFKTLLNLLRFGCAEVLLYFHLRGRRAIIQMHIGDWISNEKT